MRRLTFVPLMLIALAVAPASADPGITVLYRDGFLRVTLDGSYAGSYFLIWRSGELVGRYDPLSAQLTLCTGECSLADDRVIPGRTYFYRFDLQSPEGGLASYGPYAVTVPNTPIGARVWPNPSNGEARIELSVPGSSRYDAPVQADARLVDLQGRTVRMLHSGPLSRGVTSLTWDGRSDSGQRLGAGIYFVRLTTPLGVSTARLVRFR